MSDSKPPSGRVGPRSDARDIYEAMAADLSGLKRHWDDVTGSGPCCGSRSGGWDVRKEHEGERLGPPFHEVAIYVERAHHKREVGRWRLDEAPEDPTDEVKEALGIE